MKLTIEEKQDIYEYLLKIDCPDLLAALIAERSFYSFAYQIDSRISDFIGNGFPWHLSKEEFDFWSELYEEVEELERADITTEVVPDPSLENEVKKVYVHMESSPFPKSYGRVLKPSLWDKIKLFFGKIFYKV